MKRNVLSHPLKSIMGRRYSYILNFSFHFNHESNSSSKKFIKNQFLPKVESGIDKIFSTNKIRVEFIKEKHLFEVEPDNDINSFLKEKPSEELFEIKHQDEKIKPLHKIEKTEK